ncbi:MAG TPA: hypothetical protein VFH61_08430 [Thermoleophilia bacterium]|nr:hypothetical protein [Thermoleophilia bacterium]
MKPDEFAYRVALRAVRHVEKKYFLQLGPAREEIARTVTRPAALNAILKGAEPAEKED